MGSTFGLPFSISHFIFFHFDLPRPLQNQRASFQMKNLLQFHQGFVTSSCEFILSRDVYHIPDSHMAQFPALCDYI
jgi:hypothetical protein